MLEYDTTDVFEGIDINKKVMVCASVLLFITGTFLR